MKKFRLEIGDNAVLVIIVLASLLLCGKCCAQNQIPGTVVTAPVVPNDIRDEYPTHIDKYGLGGYRIVKTKGERDSIKVSLRVFGMLVNVSKLDSTFRLIENPLHPGDLSNGIWYDWLPLTNQATYNLVKQPVEDYKTAYPFKLVREPIYYANPFLTRLYFLRVNCYNDRGMVPYIILDQKPDYFTLDVSEPCTCTWEARAIN